MRKFIQELRRVARESRYKKRLLVEEFKRGISATIYWRFMKSEEQPSSIK